MVSEPPTELVGFVVKERLGIGSGHERDVAVLKTDDGSSHTLLRDATSFSDSELIALAGKRLRVQGTRHLGRFSVNSWSEIPTLVSMNVSGGMFYFHERRTLAEDGAYLIEGMRGWQVGNVSADELNVIKTLADRCFDECAPRYAPDQPANDGQNLEITLEGGGGSRQISITDGATLPRPLGSLLAHLLGDLGQTRGIQ